MSEERFKLSLTYSHSQGYGAAIYHGGNKLTFEEVSALLNTAVFTREEAMAKWGLIERPHIVMGDDYYDGDFTVVTVNGVAIDCHYGEGNSNDLEPTDRHLWGVTVVENLQRALGITEGGGE